MKAAFRDDRYRIERAAPWHVRFLQEIESEAARLFEGHGLPEIADEEPTGEDEFHQAQRAGLLWVAVSDRGEPVGFALVRLLDEGVHLEEIDVHPGHGRRGLGSALVREVCRWARGRGYRGVTLTTFRDIPFNAPLYARLGFHELAPASLSPALVAIVREETERGLDPDRRIVMRRALADAS